MPNETVRRRIERVNFQEFFFMRNDRQSMVSLHRIARECALQYPRESASRRLQKLPEIMREIAPLNGKRELNIEVNK